MISNKTLFEPILLFTKILRNNTEITTRYEKLFAHICIAIYEMGNL